MNERLDAVIESATKHRQQFERFCRSLSDEELHRPIPKSHWQVRDYISHLASVDIFVGGWFEGVVSGRQGIPNADDGRPFNIDTWNDDRIAERKDATVEELLSEAAARRQALFETFDRFTGEMLAQRFDFRGRGVSLIEYLELWILHDPAHAFDMARALPERKSDPELQQWLAVLDPRTMAAVADVEAKLT